MLPRIVIGLSFLLLPGVMLAPVWALSGLGASEDDILYYLPMRALFGEMIAAGQLPWWQDWTGLGRPYLADPQTAVFYPGTWLFAILPAPVAYAASRWAHSCLAAWGTYRLLRAQHFGRLAAWFGALAFAFCGFMLAHRAHFAMQHAAAWLPWVAWRLRRYAAEGGAARLAVASVVAAVQCFTGHVQVAALTALGTGVLELSGRTREIWRDSWRWLAVWLLAGLIFSAQWLPTVHYLRECTRVERGYLAFVENSWYPQSAIGFLLPMLYGQRTPNFFGQPYWGPSHQVEQFCYVGILPLILALLALRPGWRADPHRRRWVVLAGFALLLALGLFGPICPLLYWLPGASLFRVPARALVLVHLCVAALSAHTLNELHAKLSPPRARLRAALLRLSARPSSMLAIGLLGPIVLLAAAAPFLPAETRAAALGALQPANPALWVPLLALLAGLLVVRAVAGLWNRPAALLLIPLVSLVDLGLIGWTLDVPAAVGSREELLRSPGRDAWRAAIGASEARLWSVTSRAGWLPGEYVDSIGRGVANASMLSRVRTLTDYGPLQPRGVRAQFGFEPWGESLRAADLLGETSWMQWFNVEWVLLCDPKLSAPVNAEPVLTTPAGDRLFRYPAARGAAYFTDASAPAALAHQQRKPYSLLTRVSAGDDRAGNSAPLRLVVAAYAAPGWRAAIDGQAVEIHPWRSLLLSIEIPRQQLQRAPGRAVSVEWSYEPPGLRAGGALSAAGLAIAAGLVLRSHGGRVTRRPRARKRSSGPRSRAAARRKT